MNRKPNRKHASEKPQEEKFDVIEHALRMNRKSKRKIPLHEVVLLITALGTLLHELHPYVAPLLS
ncbi:hypothetical protein [Variovorax terrae]|uniref:Uncharacterized protein n=1 Tax=Variovorax terrae TaxID=2923278 RepID=A0A9X1VVE7_9BURK|nr:hypothetical protein [Variovorax terrae]MCJ0764513.1 hypothetical protein [Variovorax terrae]MCJ0764521.1 hypothetical protein [Variovorax terrae]